MDVRLRRRLLVWVVLILVVALAFVLRVWGIGNGLPYSALTDEVSDLSTSLRIAAGERPQYTLRRVGWPVSQLPAHGLHFLYLKLTHPGFSLADFEAHYFTHRGDFVLTARLLVAALSSLSVLGGYFIVRAVTDSVSGGVLAALLLAVHPAHVYIAHVALPDGFSLTWVVVAILASVYVAKTGSRRAYLLAGVAAAVVMLARLQHSTVLLPVALAHVVHWWRQPQRPLKMLLTRWLWAFGGFIIAVILLNPFVFMEPLEAFQDGNAAFTKRFGPQASFDTHLEHAIENMRLPVVMARPYVAVTALIGLALAVWRRDLEALLVAVFGVGVALSLAPLVKPKISYLLPTAVPAVLMVGYGIAVARRSEWRWLRWGAVGVFFVLLGWSLAETIMIDRALGNPNTKVAAYEWVTENVPAETSVLSGEPYVYSVPLARTEESIERLVALERLTPDLAFQLDNPELGRRPQYDLYGPEYQSQIKSDEAWWAFVRENQVEYVIESDYCGSQGYRYDAKSSIQFPVLTDAVREDLVLLAVFSPFTTDTCQRIIPERLNLRHMELAGWRAIGPLIRVYRVPPES